MPQSFQEVQQQPCSSWNFLFACLNHDLSWVFSLLPLTGPGWTFDLRQDNQNYPLVTYQIWEKSVKLNFHIYNSDAVINYISYFLEMKVSQ